MSRAIRTARALAFVALVALAVVGLPAAVLGATPTTYDFEGYSPGTNSPGPWDAGTVVSDGYGSQDRSLEIDYEEAYNRDVTINTSEDNITGRVKFRSGSDTSIEAGDTTNTYTQIQPWNDGAELQLSAEGGGSDTTGKSISAGRWYRFHFKLGGDVFRFKMWEAGTSEPSSWDISVSGSHYEEVEFGISEKGGYDPPKYDIITVGTSNLVEQETVSGTVSDGNGDPLSDATVEAVDTSTGSTEATTTTNATGDYEMGVESGEYNITASADGYANTTKTVTVPDGGTTVNFSLTAGTTITDPDPPDGATVSEPPVELSVLATSDNESVQSITVEFYRKQDGSSDTEIGSSTVSPSQRAAIMWDPPPGAYEWYAVGTSDSGARDTGGPYALGIGEADIVDGSEQPPDGAVVDPVEDVELAVDVRVDDDATVEFYDYETGNPANDPLIGTQSVSSGTSTASTTWKSENRSASEEWYAVLKDSTGTRDTAGAFAFGAGGVVVARDAETGNVIDDRTTRFDAVYPGGSQTFDRVPANLTLSEVNSEPGDSIRIDVRAQDYYERTIEVSGKQTDADVYLERGANWSYNPSSDNPDQTASVDDDPDRFISRFTLKDQTGRYPPSDTKLNVRADIDDDGQTDLVHSSTFGAANRVDVRVKRDRRYQLVVENGDGDSRGLGGWTATEPETTTLTISRVTEDIEIDQGYGVDAEVDSGTLKIYYRDYETRAETLDLEIREYPDGPYLENRTLTDVTNATVTIALNESQANKIWQIDYDGTRVGVEAANISGQVTTSPSGRVPLPVGSDVLIAGALIILAIVGALFTGPLSAVGSVAMVGVAGVLYFIGWLPINAVALWVAGIVAVGSVLRSGGGRLG